MLSPPSAGRHSPISLQPKGLLAILSSSTPASHLYCHKRTRRPSTSSLSGCTTTPSAPHAQLVHPHFDAHQPQSILKKMSRSLMITRIGNVQQEEKKIKFGGCLRAWKEVEADEATFDKKTLTPEEDMHDDGKPVLWEQWGAIVQRGNPQALVLTKLNPAMTVPRAPGPRAIRKADWKPLARRLLMNRNVILHTDSARSNRMKLPGVVHDAVVHKERKVKKNNKWVWLKPTVVRISKHKLPDGRKISCKAGTQIVDRAWKFIKERLCRNQHVKASSLMLTAQIRSAQYEYWHRKDDLWVCTGEPVAQYMKGII